MALTMPAMVRTSYPYRGSDRIILRGYCQVMVQVTQTYVIPNPGWLPP